MNETRSPASPRIWAVASITLGILCAFPFLRRPPTASETAEPSTATSGGPAFDSGGPLAASLPEPVTGWETRTVAGNLPSTTISDSPKLPDWVTKPSPLDELIQTAPQSTSRQESMARAEAITNTTLREFRTWRSVEKGAEQHAAPLSNRIDLPSTNWNRATSSIAAASPFVEAPALQNTGGPVPTMENASAQVFAELPRVSESRSQVAGAATDTWPDQRLPLVNHREPTQQWPESTPPNSRLADDNRPDSLPRESTTVATALESSATHGLISATLRQSPAALDHLPAPSHADNKTITETQERKYVYQPGLKRQPSATSDK